MVRYLQHELPKEVKAVEINLKGDIRTFIRHHNNHNNPDGIGGFIEVKPEVKVHPDAYVSRLAVVKGKADIGPEEEIFGAVVIDETESPRNVPRWLRM